MVFQLEISISIEDKPRCLSNPGQTPSFQSSVNLEPKISIEDLACLKDTREHPLWWCCVQFLLGKVKEKKAIFQNLPIASMEKNDEKKEKRVLFV